ncbi:MAG: hypothetical protein U0X86_000068 [Wolbachia endosymbiont of Xenopsylla cheopis]
MGHSLKEEEFNYKKELFANLGIEKLNAIGKAYEALRQLIEGSFKKLVLNYHPDKNSNATKEEKDILKEKTQKLIEDRKNLSKYIIPLQKGYNLVKESSISLENLKRRHEDLAKQYEDIDKQYEEMVAQLNKDYEKFLKKMDEDYKKRTDHVKDTIDQSTKSIERDCDNLLKSIKEEVNRIKKDEE